MNTYNETVKPKILVVDDEEGIRKQLKWALSSQYDVLLAQDKQSALKVFKESTPQVVALDINLYPYSDKQEQGMEILEDIISLDPRIKVIMITGNDKKEFALRAIEIGAYDYFLKPIDIEELKVLIKRALYIQRLEQENEKLAKDLETRHKFEDIIGDCPQMQGVFAMIKKAAPTDITVLIEGESGTGKELVAQAIHNNSPRKDKPFVIINCGAIPENLLESELFGHEKGSFTDAHAQRKGKFEMAEKGTIFLDEIGELSLSLQVKLLRFLQERVIERVGANQRIELDVRIIAATNSNLKKRAKEGTFREDLYYRLSVLGIHLPPLRERGDDIPLLMNSYLNRFNRKSSKKIKGISKQSIKAAREYPWPGNIRELENKLKRAVILTSNSLISAEDLGLKSVENNQSKLLKEARQQLEIKFIKEALTKTRGNVSQAARKIGISRVSFYGLMKKYDIMSPNFTLD